MNRLTVVSADGHLGAPYEVYRPYIEAAYRDRLDDLAEEAQILDTMQRVHRASMEIPGVYEVGLEAMDVSADASRRVAVQDAEGVAAEIALAGAHHASPFFHVLNKPYPADVRAAGVRAYNRWAVDLVAEAKGRLFAAGYPGEIADMDESLAELHWMAEHGFVSAFAPGYVLDPSRPSLLDPSYDRYWAACVDLDLVVNMHAGWGAPQGLAVEAARRMLGGGPRMMEDGFDLKHLEASMKKAANVMDADRKGSPFTLDLGPRQVLWQLMLGGVFDRFPSLRFVLTEVRADWIPPTLAHLDERFRTEAPHLKLTPSEYFVRNCAVTPSTPHRAEIAMRHEIGVDQFLFGADIPHPEGTWPNTRAFLSDAFAGVPEDEGRKILSENAIRFYHLDGARLAEIGNRIGPTAEEVFAGPAADEGVVGSLDARAGYLKPAQDPKITEVDELLDADLATVGAGAS